MGNWRREGEMNQNGVDEAKAARIQKYKEERRRQLTARTAAIMSTNVTERRPSRKQSDLTASADRNTRLKSSSELDLRTSASGVAAIRTTRASRLRAAAAASVDTIAPPKNAITPPKNANAHAKIAVTPPKNACANAKNSITPPKNAISKNNPKSASTLSLDDHAAVRSRRRGVEASTIASEVRSKRKSIDRLDSKTKRDRRKPSPKKAEEKLGGECLSVDVKRVQRFSELLSNVVSPGEAERLFEDLVTEDGLLDHDIDLSRLTETPRCSGAGAGSACAVRRAPLASPARPRRDAPHENGGTPVPPSISTESAETAAKRRYRRSLEVPAAKTETALPSSRISPKCFLIAAKKESPTNSSRDSKSPSTSPQCTSAASKTYQRRDSSTKPSFIPLSRRSAEAERKPAPSPTKLEPNTEAISWLPDHNFKKNSTNESNSARNNSNPKVKNDVDLNRLDKTKRTHKNNGTSEKFSKKRLTSLDNSKDTFGVRKSSAKGLLDDRMQTEQMSTVHGAISHAAASARSDANLRLSQRMDSLTAFTKHTLDRVSKLSNNDKAKSVVSEDLKLEPDTNFDTIFASTTPAISNGIIPNYRQTRVKQTTAGVTERRLKDIDMAAERLRDFEKQSAMNSLCDLKNDASQNRRIDTALSSSLSHTPVSILKRKSIQEESAASHLMSNAIASPPVTFSPSVVDPLPSKVDSRLKQGILKKRRSLDESQVSRQRSCSPEVSFADDGSPDINRSILKNRRSSLEDVVRTQSPDGQIQGILKRKMSREEEHLLEDISLGSPEPQGILKRKSNSSSSSSSASSHVSIAQAVILAAAGGAEIIEDDKDSVRPILKKKSFSEERPCPEILFNDGPKPILKKKSLTEFEDYEFDRPKKPILKSAKKTSSEDGNASSFDLSEDDRSSRRPSLLKSRTSDYSGSECETTVKPILKQRCSSLTRERSQSPRPRLSFCADNDSKLSDFSNDASAAPASPLQPRNYNAPSDNADQDSHSNYPSAVLRRRNLRPRSANRSKSLACEFNAELLSILSNRRLKVDENVGLAQLPHFEPERNLIDNKPGNAESPKSFPSIAARIKILEKYQKKGGSDVSKSSPTKLKRDRDRYKTQPITLEEMRSVSSSSLEPGQTNFQPFGPVGGGSFPSRLADAIGPARSLSPPDTAEVVECGRGRRLLEALQSDLDRVLVSLDAESRALDERERRQAEADAWSLNVSCDSGVYNRASSRDSPSYPHSGEESVLTESQETKGSHASTSTEGSDWAAPAPSADGMDRGGGDADGEVEQENCRFLPGLVKSNSVVARASMWQQMQQQAKGVARPLIRHSRSKTKELGPALESISPAAPFTATATAAVWGEAPQRSVEADSPTRNLSRSLEKDDEAKLDDDDPAKMSLSEKMRMFNTRLNYKPPRAGPPAARREERSKRLQTMPVLSSDVAAAAEAARAADDERLSKSYTIEDVPRDTDFHRKMELFRSASLRNTSLKYLMEQNERNKCLDARVSGTAPADAGKGSGAARAQRMITPEVRGILKSGATAVPRARTLAKGDSSEGLEDEGINSSSDEESASASSVSSSEKSCSSSSDELPVSKPKRSPPKTHLRSNKLQSSKTDSDLARTLNEPYKIKLPCLNEMKDRLNRVHQESKKMEQPAKLGRSQLNENRVNQASEKEELAKISQPQLIEKENMESNQRFMNKKRFVKKPEEVIQLGKLRRPMEKVVPSSQSMVEEPPKIADALEAKKRFSGHFDERKPERTPEEIAAAVRKYIPQVSKSASLAALNARLVSELSGTGAPRGAGDSGSDGESSGGREVRHINTRRPKHRFVGGGGGGGGGASGAVAAGGAGEAAAAPGLQRSATHADMPQRGGTTIADRLAALQAAGANDWRSRVCRLSPEHDDTKAIERAKNRINDTLNQAVDENKKVQIEENELGSNILADRRNKLETAKQGWKKRVQTTDAALFSVAGRLERDKSASGVPGAGSPPLTPPAAPASPGVPTPNKFRSRKQGSPPNGFAAGPLRSASCAAVGALAPLAHPARPAASPATATAARAQDAFKRSQSVTDSLSAVDSDEWCAGAAESEARPVPVPRADDETFTAFFTPASRSLAAPAAPTLPRDPAASDADLDAIDCTGRQMLVSNGARRARLVNRRAASRNPLRALAARTDLRAEYTPPPATGVAHRERRRINMERVAGGVGLAAEALAALAAKEDFASVALRTPTAAAATAAPHRPQLMLLQVKGRRRVQTRLVEPVHANINRGDCFVLVTPDQVFHYLGYYSNVIERSRGSDVALHIHNHKDLCCKSSSSVITIDEQTKTYSNKHWNQFWSLVGAPLDQGEYRPIDAGHPDEDEIFESTIIHTNMCYELLDDELVPIKEFWGQVPKISMLSPSKVIVFDFGAEMYIWNGKNVSLDKRRLAAQLAQELFDEGYNYEDCHVNPLTSAGYQGSRQEMNAVTKTSNSRPEWAILTKVTQHMETILFKEKFLDWPDFTRVIKVKHQENKNSLSEITPCDAEEMLSYEYEEPDLVLEGSHIGRGTHYYDKETMRNYDIKTKSVSKWVIQEYDFQKIENETEIPEFYSGDSYIIRWEYQITVTGRELNGKPSKHNLTGRDRCAYFCWQGKDASSNEKGTAALLTVELDREKGPQVRVTQGNEPPAFLNLFQGNLIIHQGKRDSDRSRYRLYVTRGNIANEAYLLQVPCSMRQLRSRGSLLLVDTEQGELYIWHGVRSLKHTKQIAIELANKLIARKSKCLFGAIAGDLKVEEIKEGDEPKSVLDALGGANRQFYHSLLNREKETGDDVTARLFHFTDLSGQFEANEVLSPLRHADLVTPFPFEQKELYSASQPALFMLDDGKSVWLWQGWWPINDGDLEPAERNTGVGAFAARWQALRAAALQSSAAYWRAARRGGAPDVRLVLAGLEPLTFSNLFDCWSDRDDAAELNMHYGYKAGETLSGVCELSRLNSSSDVVLPLAALQQRPLPEDVHPQHLERHLSTPDFQDAFGMSKEEFAELPAWKQSNLKKELGLF